MTGFSRNTNKILAKDTNFIGDGAGVGDGDGDDDGVGGEDGNLIKAKQFLISRVIEPSLIQ